MVDTRRWNTRAGSVSFSLSDDSSATDAATPADDVWDVGGNGDGNGDGVFADADDEDGGCGEMGGANDSTAGNGDGGKHFFFEHSFLLFTIFVRSIRYSYSLLSRCLHSFAVVVCRSIHIYFRLHFLFAFLPYRVHSALVAIPCPILLVSFSFRLFSLPIVLLIMLQFVKQSVITYEFIIRIGL